MGALKRMWTTVTYINMDESQNHHAGSKKPVLEEIKPMVKNTDQ